MKDKSKVAPRRLRAPYRLRAPRRLIAVLAVAGAVLAAGAAEAAAQLRFSIAGGPTTALGSLGDEVDTGYHALLSAALSVPLLPVGIRADGMFTQFPESGEDGNFRVVSGSVNGVLSMPSVGITPYLIGGLGIYNSRFTDDDDGHGHETGSTTNVGANVGVGLRIGLPGLAVFGEARLHNLFNEGDAIRFVPLSLGVRF